ncbi:unnamed protein product [Ranitomeya imitator]|uniref:Uncharacterized protein n=1 Tax=Ranitomeya imitator TaxID=111125 RepID=A0ABN9LKC1_9NEOB|nr:unnamed protein product [Ranitomeya imitator]
MRPPFWKMAAPRKEDRHRQARSGEMGVNPFTRSAGTRSFCDTAYASQIIAFDELRTDFKNPIEQGNPSRARERVKNVERICCLLRKVSNVCYCAPCLVPSSTHGYVIFLIPLFSLRQLVVPEYCIHGLFCLMFMCAAEWVTLGLNIPLLFYHLWRYFHRPADGSEVMFDPVSIMNVDILNYCQKEAWCKLAFYLLSFFYYLYR